MRNSQRKMRCSDNGMRQCAAGQRSGSKQRQRGKQHAARHHVKHPSLCPSTCRHPSDGSVRWVPWHYLLGHQRQLDVAVHMARWTSLFHFPWQHLCPSDVAVRRARCTLSILSVHEQDILGNYDQMLDTIHNVSMILHLHCRHHLPVDVLLVLVMMWPLGFLPCPHFECEKK